MTLTGHDQLLDEAEVVAMQIGAVLGMDLYDLLMQRAHDRAPALLAAVLDETDDRIAAGTAMDVMALLWGRCDPDPDWWHTPLGRLLARPLAREDAESVTHSVAAAMLGVTRGTVGRMVYRGTLDRHPDGGVLRASVLRRLGREIAS